MSMEKKSRLFCWLLVSSLVGLGGADLQAAEPKTLKTTDARFATTYESVTLPLNEQMGLLGGSSVRYQVPGSFQLSV